MEKLTWGTTKVRSDVENAQRELAVNMSHYGPEHWKSLGSLIGDLKGKEKKGIVIRKPKVLKYVIFFNSNYATYKETRNIVSSLVTTLGRELIMCLSKTQRTVTLISTEAEYVALVECAQEVKFVRILLEEIYQVKNQLVVYEDNKRTIFLANNRQVGMRTKHIDICHHFLSDKVEDKDIGINYIRSD